MTINRQKHSVIRLSRIMGSFENESRNESKSEAVETFLQRKRQNNPVLAWLTEENLLHNMMKRICNI